MAAMQRPNRNCCWVGQPDPTAWKKPTGEGCAGWWGGVEALGA